ncbi:hypothetical protein BV22DRAFT_1014820 [Leucogyrophana mollusca]|uniref:Uncharacterized protein n=1 Tax=Leucogyrophana mollusca TaxID=85980 RepID=A0ACB8BDB5_9AGAM|nr:hypothetical protein BV22DRAFT_1014820 [Leucogyrophana mollusca]
MISCSQITRVAAERSAQKRLEFLTRIGTYMAEQLVFVDESSVDRRTTYRGRACFSVLPALSLNDGILHCDVVEGSFCTETFKQFIERLLDQMQPFPAPNSVIVMDNCRIHKHPEIQELIEAR